MVDLTGISNLSSQSGSIFDSLLKGIISIPGVDTFFKILSALGLVIIVYVIFLIIRSIVQIKDSLRIKSIANNVDEINKKMDVLISKGKKNKF